MPQAARKRPGRRPGASHARETILATARSQFATHGYEAASMRSIAREADVDPALVLHYYGSKQALFTTAMAWPFETAEALVRVVPGPRGELGRRLAAYFLSIWDDPAKREPVMGLLRAATTSPHAAELLRATLGTQLMGPLAEHLAVPDAELRMSLCGTQLVGLGIARYIVGLEPLASLAPARVVELIGPVLQGYMTGEL
jgi:AcrR family transcriptional regulator